MRYDINGNIVTPPSNGGSSELNTAFDVKRVTYGSNEVAEFNGDGTYYPNPFIPAEGSVNAVNVYFLDENKNNILVYDSDGKVATHSIGCFIFAKRISLQIDGLTITTRLYVNYDRYLNDMPSNVYTYTLEKLPTYVKFNSKVTYNIESNEEIADGLYMAHYNDDVCVGLYEQINEYVQKKTDERMEVSLGRRSKSLAVDVMNRARDAFRIATYNIYGAGHAQRNWNCVKEQLQEFGIDFCACQEVKSPNGNLDINHAKIFSDEMKSWQFLYCSSNGDLYPTNERMLLSRFPVLSSYEWEFAKWSSDRRCCAKYEVQLPLYKDRVGSDQLKMSIYNTQLEVYPTSTGNATNRISETQEILDMIAEDKNPFIVVCMDSNDFSPDKEIWKMFTDAGFTYAIPIKTQTVTAQDNCIDQIFVNANMEVLNYDVINGNLYQFFYSDKMNPVSDHDLCFADIQLNYENFYCIKQKLTNVISDCTNVIVDNDSALTINLTPDDGYTLGTVKVRMGADDVTASVYTDGVITIPAVTGDLYIIATGTAE